MWLIKRPQIIPSNWEVPLSSHNLESVSELFSDYLGICTHGTFEVTPKQEDKRANYWGWSSCVCKPLTPHYNQLNIHEILRPDYNLVENIYFSPYLSHDWKDFASNIHLALATHALLKVSIWLQSVTNEGHFAYRTYYLFAYICASILVIFIKIDLRAQMGVSLLKYE
jgi:hypothetical protein